MNNEYLQIAVFASGGGSNFQAIIDSIENGEIPATIGLCISNKPEAGALKRAERHGIPVAILSPGSFETEKSYCSTLLDVLKEHQINFIVLAGYMRMIPAEIVRSFHGRMINIHPALLPAFGGKGMFGRYVHEAVLAYGARWTGVTVHLVDEEYDHGPIVLQQPVPVMQDDTPETLAARVLEVEHILYPQAVRLFAEGKISIEGRKVHISEPKSSISPLP